jgi:malate dehydrogenase (oxaloacetate-decarboxylating)
VAEWAGPAVLTDQDATAIAVAASLLTALARADLDPASSRVVITGATTLSLLRPLLIAAGIGEIDSWNAVDAVGFGLKRLAYGADAVIDLIGRASRKLHFDQAQPILISPGPRIDDRIAVPGLLMAILQCSARIIDMEAYDRCVLTLVAATPPGRLLPEPDPNLALVIADTAAAGLRRRHAQPRSTRLPKRGLG